MKATPSAICLMMSQTWTAPYSVGRHSCGTRDWSGWPLESKYSFKSKSHNSMSIKWNVEFRSWPSPYILIIFLCPPVQIFPITRSSFEPAGPCCDFWVWMIFRAKTCLWANYDCYRWNLFIRWTSQLRLLVKPGKSLTSWTAVPNPPVAISRTCSRFKSLPVVHWWSSLLSSLSMESSILSCKQRSYRTLSVNEAATNFRGPERRASCCEMIYGPRP